MKHRITSAVVGGLLAFGALAPAQAALVDVNGTNVIYSYDTDQFAGFSATVSTVGDSLRILFNEFDVTDTSASPGPSQRNGTFTISVKTSNPGLIFSTLAFEENGDYRLNDLTTGNYQATSVGGQFRVYNDNPGAQSSVQSFSTGDLVTLNAGLNPVTHPWETTAASAVGSWSSDAVTFQIENILLAFALGDDLSFIEKKYILVTPSTTEVSNPVPVPASVWLMGTALLALVGIRRRAA